MTDDPYFGLLGVAIIATACLITCVTFYWRSAFDVAVLVWRRGCERRWER